MIYMQNFTPIGVVTIAKISVPGQTDINNYSTHDIKQNISIAFAV